MSSLKMENNVSTEDSGKHILGNICKTAILEKLKIIIKKFSVVLNINF